MGDLAVVLLLLTVFSRTVAFAQNFSLISGRDRVVSLNGLWRFHTGDDPTWANPDFDDSQWPLIRSDRSWTEQGYPAFTGFAWYRFKVEVPDDGKPVGLLVDETVNGYKVFANGRLLGSGGSAEPTWDPVFESYPTVYPIPLGAKGPQTIVIALRVWSYRPIASWLGAGPIVGGCRFGDPNPLAYQATLIMSDRTTNFVNEYAFALFAALVGFAVLSLFSYRPADKEYLWFAVLLLAECADGVVHLCLNLKGMPFLTWRFCSIRFRGPGTHRVARILRHHRKQTKIRCLVVRIGGRGRKHSDDSVDLLPVDIDWSGVHRPGGMPPPSIPLDHRELAGWNLQTRCVCPTTSCSCPVFIWPSLARSDWSHRMADHRLSQRACFRLSNHDIPVSDLAGGCGRLPFHAGLANFPRESFCAREAERREPVVGV